MPPNADFVVEVDAAARAWLESHKSEGPRVITYDIHHCCGGGKICDVRVQEAAHGDDFSHYAEAVLPDTTKIVIDPRAAARLPSRFRLTVRRRGPLKRLDLDLSGEEWGALLYD
jgi:hypothetical protein